MITVLSAGAGKDLISEDAGHNVLPGWTHLPRGERAKQSRPGTNHPENAHPREDPSPFSTLNLAWHHTNTMNVFITLMLLFTRKKEKASGQKSASQG